ncbi:Cell division control protein 14 [Beauveria bassiana D1-5]|uniref:Cell division control protein 14 n=1 Tax=Beauveria bassiana D1-5 TaxID=1245745 RepID=A0A0A2VC97_BEABA|nr:Cell division control protein 14 [Beauveria bassiana D1-5]
MENLLSLAFDNLSSYDGPKVRKGLRQVEGLLAQICLSSASHDGSKPDQDTTRMTGVDSEDDATTSPRPPPPRKDLGRLSQDPAFREFFKLQEGFEWNIGLRLISTLDRLMAKGSDGQNDLLILSALDLLQGAMLLHPPSKGLFQREQNMNVSTNAEFYYLVLTESKIWSVKLIRVHSKLLLDLLEPFNCPAIQSATLLTLVVALIEMPKNTRVFEGLDGLLTVTSLFKSRSTSREVKLKLVEFLYFYLMPETPSIPRADRRDSLPDMLQRSPSKLASAFGGGDAAHKRGRGETGGTLSTSEKQQLLSRHLSNVEDLVKDLRTCAPFGGVVA